MSLRHTFSLILAIGCITQVGCFACLRGGCGGGIYDGCTSCGVPEASCACPSCGIADAACGCPEPACGVYDAACGVPTCGAPDGCGAGVGGGNRLGQCGVLRFLKNAICGCSSGGCSCEGYYGDWSTSPPCDCEACDHYGNHIGGPYSGATGRRMHMARQQQLGAGDQF